MIDGLADHWVDHWNGAIGDGNDWVAELRMSSSTCPSVWGSWKILPKG